MAAKKKEKPATLSAGGAPHVVYKKGNKVVADHLGKTSKDSWDKIDLTKVAGAKTVQEGVKATKAWHKKHPHKKGKK
jgi:hypothetical protein